MSDFTPLPDNFWFVQIPLVDGSGQTRPPEDRAEIEMWQKALRTLRRQLARYHLRPCVSMVKDVIDHGGLAHVTVTAQRVILRCADFTAVAYDLPTEPFSPFSETDQETHSTRQYLAAESGDSSTSTNGPACPDINDCLSGKAIWQGAAPLALESRKISFLPSGTRFRLARSLVPLCLGGLCGNLQIDQWLQSPFTARHLATGSFKNGHAP
jgi:hypothetical protein